MHPYISQALITQRIEDAIHRAEADRLHAQARMAHHRRRLARLLSRAS